MVITFNHKTDCHSKERRLVEHSFWSTYCHDEISAGNILSTESNLNDVIAGIVRCVEEIEGAIFVIDDVDIEIIAECGADTTCDCARARFMCVDSNRIFFTDVKIGTDAIA